MKKRMYLLLATYLIQILKLFSLWRQRKLQQKLLNKIKDLQILNVSDLMTKIKDGIYKINDFVLCSGTLHNPQKMTATLDPKQAIAYSCLSMQKTFEFGTRTSSLRRQIKQLHPSVLELVDMKAKKILNIYESWSTNFLAFNFRRKLKIHTQPLFNLGWVLSWLIKIPTRTISTVFIERFIPQDSHAVVLGRIQKTPYCSDKQPLQFFIKSPEFIAHSKSQLIENMLDNINEIKYEIFFLGIIMGLTAYLVTKWVLVPLVQEYLRRRASKKIQQIIIRQRKCDVCHEKLNSIVSLLCRHMAICDTCHEKEEGQNANIVCRICKKKGKQIMKIFPC